MISELYENKQLADEWNEYFKKELKGNHHGALRHFHHWLYKKYQKLEQKYERAKAFLTDSQLAQVEGE